MSKKGKTTEIVRGNARKSIVPAPKEEGKRYVRKSMAATVFQRNPVTSAANMHAVKARSRDEKNKEINEIFLAAEKGKWGTAMGMINKDNINERGPYGMTLLMEAAAQGEYVLVERLVRNGASKGLEDDIGRGAITHALLNGHNKVANLLHDLGTSWEPDLVFAVRDHRVLLIQSMKDVLGVTDGDIARVEAQCDPERGPALSSRVQKIGDEANAQQELAVALQPERLGTVKRHDPKIVETGSAPTVPKKPHITFRGC